MNSAAGPSTSLRALITEASEHERQGRVSRAEQCYREIALFAPHWADVHNNLGSTLQRQGKLIEAEQSYAHALKLDPVNAVAHLNLGCLHHTRGNLDSAADHFAQAIQSNPNYAEAHNNLGSILLDRRDLDAAAERFHKALSINPDYAEARNNLGNAFKARGQLDEAAACYRTAISLKPDYADAHNNLGRIFLEQDKPGEAITCFETALRLNPRYATAICNLGVVLKAQGKLDEAMRCFEQAIAFQPDHSDAHNNRATILMLEGRLEEAAVSCDRAIALRPDSAAAHCNRGNILRDQGRFEEAAAEYRQAISLEPGYPEALYSLAQLKLGRPDSELESLSSRIESVPLTKRAYIHFALAATLENSGDDSRYFEQLLKGNAIQRSQISYDETETRNRLQQIARIFDADLMRRFAGAGNPSSTPIFVLGMPRSGSTLVEQILSSHSKIHGAGELKLLSRVTSSGSLVYPDSYTSIDAAGLQHLGKAYLQGLPDLPAGKLRVTDKMPGNFEYVGLIHLILPNAKIIHTLRNPMDTCVSCFSKLFTEGMAYTYDLAELGRYYRYYVALMNHWRSVLPLGTMLEISYEKLIEDLQEQTRWLIQYCGLPWEDRCLDFPKNNRPVSTASSVSPPAIVSNFGGSLAQI